MNKKSGFLIWIVNIMLGITWFDGFVVLGRTITVWSFMILAPIGLLSSGLVRNPNFRMLKRHSITKPKIYLLIVIFAGLITSYLLNQIITGSNRQDYYLTIILLCLGSLILYHLLQGVTLFQILHVLGTSGVIAAILVIIEWALVTFFHFAPWTTKSLSFSRLFWQGTFRASGLLSDGDPNFAAFNLSIIFAINVGLFLSLSDHKKVWFRGVACIIVMLAVLLTGSRLGLLMTGVAIVFWTLLSFIFFKNQFSSLVGRIIGLTSIMVVSVAIVLTVYSQLQRDQDIATIIIFDRILVFFEETESRVRLGAQAVKLIDDSSILEILFGSGKEKFSQINGSNVGWGNADAHNAYLETFIRSGIMGIVFYLLLLLICFLRILHNIRYSKIDSSQLALALTLLVWFVVVTFGSVFLTTISSRGIFYLFVISINVSESVNLLRKSKTDLASDKFRVAR